MDNQVARLQQERAAKAQEFSEAQELSTRLMAIMDKKRIDHDGSNVADTAKYSMGLDDQLKDGTTIDEDDEIGQAQFKTQESFQVSFDSIPSSNSTNASPTPKRSKSSRHPKSSFGPFEEEYGEACYDKRRTTTSHSAATASETRKPLEETGLNNSLQRQAAADNHLRRTCQRLARTINLRASSTSLKIMTIPMTMGLLISTTLNSQSMVDSRARRRCSLPESEARATAFLNISPHSSSPLSISFAEDHQSILLVASVFFVHIFLCLLRLCTYPRTASDSGMLPLSCAFPAGWLFTVYTTTPILDPRIHHSLTAPRRPSGVGQPLKGRWGGSKLYNWSLSQGPKREYFSRGYPGKRDIYIY